MSLESQEVARGSSEAASESSKAAPGSPEAVPGSHEAAPGSHEAAPGSHEVAPGSHMATLESLKAVPGSPGTAPGSHDATPGHAMPAAGSSGEAPVNTDEEDDDIRYFLDEIDESYRQYQKKYDRMVEEKALREALQEKPTGLSQLQAACQATMVKVAASLQELLLPFTALHLLNLSFPGAAGTALVL